VAPQEERVLYEAGLWNPQLISNRRFRMMEKKSVQAKGTVKRLLSVSMVFMFSLSLVGCIAAVPIAVKMVKEKDMAKLTLELEGNAAEIFDASVRTTKRKNPDLEVIKEDREDLEFEAKRVKPDGKELWASWEVEQQDNNMVEIKFKVKGEDMEEEVVEKMALDGINAFCKEIGKKCNIEE
jgi:hypothetical protein